MRALVTGGAGLIGSHVVDALLRDGWTVRVLDNLEPLTHRDGLPGWCTTGAQFVQGDVRDRATVTAALDGVDVVFHQAAYGGYMPEMAKYVAVNSLATAQLLEIIRDDNLPVRKVIVASSQAVYAEGTAHCISHGVVHPGARAVHRLRSGDFSVPCPHCGQPTSSMRTSEGAPIAGQTVYALTKVDQERLVLMWGQQTGIPTVALRYSCTYGPRQSIFNPYTGVIAIFCTRLLNGQPPVLFEDGEQTRDFSYVEDVARANLAVAASDQLNGLAVNVGSGCGVTVRELACRLADALGVQIAPVVSGEFRPGEMRHLRSDTSLLASIGHTSRVDLETGIARYLAWIGTRSDVREYFTQAADTLRSKGILQLVQREPVGTT
ncbi:MAG: NAD-dependent epimerase/dehydratase family protein [Candidatus Eremiobacteraeota bacterium]|nr:NAD-dependent epimerase/dehydratase family protein [Candidatus Eremiobacteraeota bacterium]